MPPMSRHSLNGPQGDGRQGFIVCGVSYIIGTVNIYYVKIKENL